MSLQKYLAEREMAAYDRLPPSVRLALQNSSCGYAALDLWGVWLSEKEMLNRIASWDVESEYRV